MIPKVLCAQEHHWQW